MKIHPFLLAFLLPVLVITAQETKNRLVFPSSSKASASGDESQTPVATIDKFFEFLGSGKLDEAYAGLSKIINIPGRPDSAKEFKDRTQIAIDSFGPVNGYEVVDSMLIGKVLFRQTCVSLNEDSPLRWRFYFYRSGSDWKLIDLRVDDGIVDLFEELSNARKR